MEARADHVGQHVSIRGVALRAGNPEQVPVPGGLQRVDRQDRVAGRHQRPHPRAPVSLNPDPHLADVSVLTKMIADHRMQPGHTSNAVAQPRFRQPTADHVLNLNIMMRLRPVIPDEQHQSS